MKQFLIVLVASGVLAACVSALPPQDAVLGSPLVLTPARNAATTVASQCSAEVEGNPEFPTLSSMAQQAERDACLGAHGVRSSAAQDQPGAVDPTRRQIIDCDGITRTEHGTEGEWEQRRAFLACLDAKIESVNPQ